jgi:hypothetical protein
MAYVGTPIDTINQFQSLVGKRFSGDASTTAFTLDVAPTSTLDIEVFVENVRQDPNSAYSLSGTTLTFAAAPPSGTNNIYVVHQAKAVGTISPAAGTVNADSFDNTVISGHTALTSEPADTDEFLVSDAGTIKRIDYSLIKAGLPGISMADQWRLNANKTGTGVISANLERVDTDGYGQLGTGMTESSGNLTIATDNNVNVSIETTQDNSSYNAAAVAKADSSTQTGTTQFIFDVTDTSTHKVNFNVFSISGTLQGSTDLNNTSFTFIRLGDT